MTRSLQSELTHLAAELRAGGADPEVVARTANRLQNLAALLADNGLVLVQPKVIQPRRRGTPYVQGDMVLLEREKGGGAA
ncbi:MAG: hypothetical protein ACOY93_08575 [Bacillota bacterium]